MKINYPLSYTTTPSKNVIGLKLVKVSDGDREAMLIGWYYDQEANFIGELVVAANNASTIQADYDRLEAKIDAMVEARVNTVLGHGWTKNQQLQKIRQLESDAFVDAKAREALRKSNNELTKYSAQLRRDNEELVGRVNGLLEERDSIVAANNSYSKELESLRKAVKLFKHTVGEQRQHLRRLRAKLVKRALRAGEERAKTAAWIAEAEKLQALYEKEQVNGVKMFNNVNKLQHQLEDIRRYMHEQGWKLPAEPRSTYETHDETPAASLEQVYDRIKKWREGTGKAIRQAHAAYATPFSDRMFEEAAQPRRKVVHADNAKFNDFYRELGELLTKSFGLPKYPFPKKGE